MCAVNHISYQHYILLGNAALIKAAMSLHNKMLHEHSQLFLFSAVFIRLHIFMLRANVKLHMLLCMKHGPCRLSILYMSR